MESLVYENSPLAEYLRGKIPSVSEYMSSRDTQNLYHWNNSGEGEGDQSWVIPETDNGGDISDSTPDFAPRGTSKFQDRVRNKLPKPLSLKNPGRRVALSRFYDACSV